MKKLLVLSVILSVIAVSNLSAQLPGKVNIGIGAGLDYGGFGAQFSFLPIERIGLFAGLGYNLDGLGYNVGAQLRFPSEKRMNFYLTGMYGYNGVIIVSGAMNTKTTYYGPSVGAGFIIKSRKNDRSYWNFEVLVPFRSQEFKDEIDALKSMGAEIVGPFPVAICFGYHFKIL